jgi:hypothetical protein
MYILMLDDQQVRHDVVERHFAREHIVLHAFNFDDAVEILNSCQHRIGLAMLDHDLQDFKEQDGRIVERHGAYFVDYMLNFIPEDKWPVQYVLHSYNYNGATNMHIALRKRTDAPITRGVFCGEFVAEIVRSIKAQ